MPRYIKVEDAIKVADYECGQFRGIFARIKDRLETIPTADLVVRCKECIHHKNANQTLYVWCECLDGLLPPDWFCADGERREDENMGSGN